MREVPRRGKRGALCQVCRHAQLAEIEVRLAARVPMRLIGMDFGLSIDALGRHRRRHMSDELIQSLQAAGQKISPDALAELKQQESDGLLQTLVHERVRQQRLADRGEELGDLGNATRASAAAIKTSELIAKLLGDIKTGTTKQTVNILVQPEFTAFRAALIRSLRPYPDAQRAVLAELHKLEGIEDANRTDIKLLSPAGA